jgi:GNAT superfamily N-acetyltransferase
MVAVRAFHERDLGEAARIVRVAFGTFLDLPEPEQCFADRDYVHSRFGAEHVAAFAAEEDGALVGSNFATRWGSFGFFGPLSIRPDRWNGGCAQPLVGAVCEAFERWRVSLSGLFTFAESAKHVHLYGKFGFYARFLTAVMARPAQPASLPARSRYSALPPADRRAAEDAAYALTDSIWDGLDLRGEIRTVAARNLGDTLLLWDGSRLAGFAVCHWGPASEAGADRLYVKFGAVRSGSGAAGRFAALLDAVAALAAAAGMKAVLAGVNLGRENAYRQMAASGFRSEFQGVAMHRDNRPGFSRPDAYVIDDWR